MFMANIMTESTPFNLSQRGSTLKWRYGGPVKWCKIYFTIILVIRNF